MTLDKKDAGLIFRKPARRTVTPASFLLLLCAVAACGKKGPPLSPLPRVPAAVATVTTARVGDDVYVSFTVPVANVDGHQPADIASVELYAVTATHPPETEEQRKVATLVATLPVQPILPELPPAKDGTPPPALPVPPGVVRGSTAVFRERLTDAALVAVELPTRRIAVPVEEVPAAEGEPLSLPLVAPAPAQLPRRYYFLVGVSPRGRSGAASAPVPVVLDPTGTAPGAPTITVTESSLQLTWAPSPDARTSTIVPVVPAAPVPVVAPDVTAGDVTPAIPVPVKVEPPPIVAKSLGFNVIATTYNVFEVSPEEVAEDPLAIALPKPLTPQPLPSTEFSVKSVTFGAQRCFEVRAVDMVNGVAVQGPASPRSCVTPQDTFPPASPKSLAAIAGAGVINLIWEPNAEADLAGYLVLRGEAPGDTLTALTPAPVRETTYRDTTVRPGVRYVYVVVAVDTATPQNVSGQSNRAEETARQ